MSAQKRNQKCGQALDYSMFAGQEIRKKAKGTQKWKNFSINRYDEYGRLNKPIESNY